MSVGWGRLSWGQASWNDATTIKEGWGRFGWGSQSYGDTPSTATLSGQQATTSVGSITVELRPGWGTLDWGENGWGSVRGYRSFNRTTSNFSRRFNNCSRCNRINWSRCNIKCWCFYFCYITNNYTNRSSRYVF